MWGVRASFKGNVIVSERDRLVVHAALAGVGYPKQTLVKGPLMSVSKRLSVVLIGLLMAGSAASSARANAEDVYAESAIVEIHAPAAYLSSVPGEDLPDAPSPSAPQQTQIASAASPDGGGAGVTSAAVDPLAQGRQTKRIMFIVPNFRAVSADQTLPPQSVKEKLKSTMLDSFDYSSFMFVGVQAGIGQATNSYPYFGQGMKGYGRYYWHTLADAINENAWVGFIVPSLLQQDNRYYTLGQGPISKRMGYAVTRVFITRTDDGNKSFNYSEVLGAGAFSAVANLYYPSQERTLVKTYQRWVTNLAIDGGVFVFKEVWPDLNNAFFHEKD
jgi:hypothetical protein